MALASIAVEELLLILKIAFVVLLYLFIWRIVRTASKDLRTPQESFILAPSQANELFAVRDAGPRDVGRLVVITSPTLEEGEGRILDSAAITVGRGPQNDVTLDGDDYASAKHARISKALRAEHRTEIALREGRLRVSPHFYNTEEQIDRLIGHLPPGRGRSEI